MGQLFCTQGIPVLVPMTGTNGGWSKDENQKNYVFPVLGLCVSLGLPSASTWAQCSVLSVCQQAAIFIQAPFELLVPACQCPIQVDIINMDQRKNVHLQRPYLLILLDVRCCRSTGQQVTSRIWSVQPREEQEWPQCCRTAELIECTVPFTQYKVRVSHKDSHLAHWSVFGTHIGGVHCLP
jgi:hypothetical protein